MIISPLCAFLCWVVKLIVFFFQENKNERKDEPNFLRPPPCSSLFGVGLWVLLAQESRMAEFLGSPQFWMSLLGVLEATVMIERCWARGGVISVRWQLRWNQHAHLHTDTHTHPYIHTCTHLQRSHYIISLASYSCSSWKELSPDPHAH